MAAPDDPRRGRRCPHRRLAAPSHRPLGPDRGVVVAALASIVLVGEARNLNLLVLGDDVAGFSNSADFLALLAPGVSVESSVTGDGFGRKSGTSMAAPHVAGAWAVLKEAAPGAEVDQIEALLADTGVPIQDDRDGAGDRVKPRIQIDAAIDLLFCDPPSSGDWRIDHLCFLDRPVVAPRNLVVEPEGELVVTGAAALNIDFSNHHLLIRDGSRVRVLEGGKIH